MVLVCILRDRKNNIIYNSGLLYFTYPQNAQLLKDSLSEEFEIHEVDTEQAHEPENTRGGYWCPYCQNWEYWGSDKICPVCGISSSDYAVRSMNNLWTDSMKSKTAKKRLERKR